MKTLMTILLCGLCVGAHAGTNFCYGLARSGDGSGRDWGNIKQWRADPFVRDSTNWIRFETNGYDAINLDQDLDVGENWVVVKKATTNEHYTATGWSDWMGRNPVIIGTITVFTPKYILDGTDGGGPTENWTNNFGFKIVAKASSSCVLVKCGNGIYNIAVKHLEVAGIGTANWPTIEYNLNSPVTFDYRPTPGNWIYGSNYIGYCYFHDMGIGVNTMNVDFWDGGIIEYVFATRMGYGSDGGHSTGLWQEQSRNMVVRHNIFHDMHGTQAYGVMGSNHVFYGNVYYADGDSAVGNGAFACWSSAPGSMGKYCYNIKFFHNTVVDCGTPADSGGGAFSFPWEGIPEDGGSKFGEIHLFNNLIYKWAPAAPSAINQSTHVAWTGKLFSGYNYVFTDDAGNYSTNPLDHNVALDNAIFTNYAARNFRLAVQHLAGTNLGTAYATDAYGVDRTGVWSVGAYECPSVLPSAGLITISRMDPGPSQFESNATVRIYVNRSDGSSSNLSVSFHTIDDSAVGANPPP